MTEEYKCIIEQFTEISKEEKEKEILDELQEILVVFYKLCKDKKINNEILIHHKMQIEEKNNLSEDEFLDKIFAYILSIKESIGNYLLND